MMSAAAEEHRTSPRSDPKKQADKDPIRERADALQRA